jgi:pyruvate/2-oxoglutarate dehydrogenase complex dihydrolipoamide dehydrogenase (E3) component
MTQAYDLLIIGGGAAGSTAASFAKEKGARVALVEQDRLGGTCLNYGCDPTKTLLHIANILYEAKHADQYGLDIPLVRADWPLVLARVEKTLNQIRGGTPEEAQKKLQVEGLDLYMGQARFLSPHEILVGDQTLQAERIIIATGTAAVIPDLPGLVDAGYLTNVEAVSLPEIPERLGIIGGGPLGIEFAQIFSRFGAEVTVLEQASQILPGEETDLVKSLADLLEQEGIVLRLEAEVQRVETDKSEKQIFFRCDDKKIGKIVVDEILVALGRRPFLDGLNLEAAGVETDEEGIVVKKTLQTSVPHIWAAGDVATSYQFTQVAAAQGELVARNAFADEPEPFDETVIPWVTYTYPSLAHVGQTEKQLREAGTAHETLKTSLAEVDRAVSMGQTAGSIKLLVSPEGKILGGHVLAPDAGDVLAPIILAMKTGLSIDDIAEVLFPYPTLVRGLNTTAKKANEE